MHFTPILAFVGSTSRRHFTAAARPSSYLHKHRTPWKPLLWGSVFALSTSILFPPVICLDAAAPIYVEDTFVDPATGIAFPTTLRITSKVPLPLFSLVGVGVRTVSFLGIKVYSIGFYADLTNPNLKIPISVSPDEKIQHIIRNTACVVRIIPTRSTSHTHLRDAFIRSLNARMRLARDRNAFTTEDEKAVQSPLRVLKSIFPTAPLLKHVPLDIMLTAPTGDPMVPRTLVIRDLGAVRNDWVGTEFMLAYFDGDGPSPALKKSVIEGLAGFGR